MTAATGLLRRLPSVDEVLRTAAAEAAVAAHGRTATVAVVRATLDEIRTALRAGPGAGAPAWGVEASAGPESAGPESIALAALARL
ncbi:hypothetical protein CH340_24605, partial [Rhodoplanes serenus]